MKCKRLFKWLLQYALYIYMHACVLSHFSYVPVFATLWTIAHQAPLSMRSSNQEYWSGLPCPPPGNPPDTRIKPMSPSAPALQVDSIPLRHQGSPHVYTCMYICTPICVFMYVLLKYLNMHTYLCVWVCIFRSLCSQYHLFFPSSLLSHILFSLLINSSTN